MKRALLVLSALFCLSLPAVAAESPEGEFADKVEQAFASGKPQSFMDLYYQGVPGELAPVFTKLWQTVLADKTELAHAEIKPLEADKVAEENRSVEAAGKVYVRTAPAVAALIIDTKAKEKMTIPLSFVDGHYYLASWKVQPAQE